MQIAALRALEFDRIVDAVCRVALTPMGEARLAQLAPSTDRAAVAHLLAETTETVRFVTAHGGFAIRGSQDLPDIFGALGVEARALDAIHLLTLATFLDSIDDVRVAIRRVAAEFPLIDRASGAIAAFRGEIAQTRRAIDPAGDVVDDASPALRSIRDRLRKQRGRLRGTLESYLRGRETAKYLQDQVITERNGRYVLVVRAEHRGGIPGIVHGASTSGASVFLEPLSTVDINNDIVALEEQEAEEIHRILLALTDAFRARQTDVEQTVAAATALDVLQARARYSQSIDGIEPALSTDGSFELHAARHPLLKAPVPVTITITPPATILLVTGPNTGGKTVALKTAGLLALMAQSGLRIPAAHGSRLPVFQSMFADIGDEQSIEASLSTFSAHITNIASMDRALATPALVLLDEVGSGTDPVEGGALGVAIVDHFRRRGATVIATSHYDALKSYASTTEGVQSAAFGFEAATFAPTYELVYGSPGRSLAIEIASRLGLSPAVITAARQNLSARETQLAEHLEKIDRELRDLQHEKRFAVRERDTLAASETRLREREASIKEREETFRRKLTQELEGQVRQARRDIDAIVDELKKKTKGMANEPSRLLVNTGKAGTVRTDARTAVDAVVERILSPETATAETTATPSPAAPAERPAAVGDRVLVGALGLEGVITGIQGNSAEVDVRGKRMRAKLGELRVLAGAVQSTVRVNVDLAPRETTSAELNVIGMTVDQALDRLERFLDEALITDRRNFRVVHGFGTGQLRRAITTFLRQHPLVATVEQAPSHQGGGGATVVEIKD
ncbi:MAG: endonuclease MutS2 [Acidobacteriaceae bacterium]|jgi:DNA mismatch repair protein MutS2|nr:endonuclease MutS2 [Acidobacteriaceae bacterium]